MLLTFHPHVSCRLFVEKKKKWGREKNKTKQRQNFDDDGFRWLQCDSGAGVDAFFHAIYTTKDSSSASSLSGKRTKPTASNGGRPFLMLLGPHCSHVTESVASVTSYWNIVQVRKQLFISPSDVAVANSPRKHFQVAGPSAFQAVL